MKHRNRLVEIKAPLVISNAGILNTYGHLLLPEVTRKYNLDKHLIKIKSGIGSLHLFVGLRGSHEELKVTARSNIWVFAHCDINKIKNYLTGTPEDAEENGIPYLFISFSSTKDPTWENRYPGKITCTVIAPAPYEWFASWENESFGYHDDDYKRLKNSLRKKIWEQVLGMFPQLVDKEEYFEIGTPLTNKHYISSPKGEIYGCDHNKERFSPETAAMLRAKTPVPGLYLTGQDIYTCGFSGAMQGGLLTSMAILERDLYRDLLNIRRH